MSWHMKFTRVVDNDAEISVYTDYYDEQDGRASEPLWHEEATFPAGTPNRAIREEMAKRGRSARLRLGKQAKKHELDGEISLIDNI